MLDISKTDPLDAVRLFGRLAQVVEEEERECALSIGAAAFRRATGDPAVVAALRRRVRWADPGGAPRPPAQAPRRRQPRDHAARMMPTTACRCGGWVEIRPASGASTDKPPPGRSGAV
ncbi:conserved hypothetical protein [Streptomyces sviceus ATCC 29083]|uniref:Uncharacterized protein n=1 Tax=Streptomyces sviceus (strain ATCC 29083 / DSM 924 / JCM 4929 / NBRC 13980 / NCIMB 11184 / NRRL 5439 / UC 5370) TaxID=463191 RepID=B5HZM8_STRX2|nr:conserved hypothetical protein [Streptomyces sviceus ATCC 29083]